MVYPQLHLQTTRVYVERLSNFLECTHVLSVTWQAGNEQALFEPEPESTPLWEKVKITALLKENTCLDTLIKVLYAKFDKTVILDFEYEYLEDQAWERTCLDGFKAMRFGKRLWVCPSAFEVSDHTAIQVRLDPGLAFGTGTHPSTALCLEWLDAHALRDKTLVDYGCGSGILGIAAIKCGVKKVFAIDHDPQALAATRMNAKRNHITMNELDCFFPETFCLDKKVDGLIANILAGPLMELASSFKCLIKKKGCCVLSGILIEQVEDVKKAYTQIGFMIVDTQYKESWARIEVNLL